MNNLPSILLIQTFRFLEPIVFAISRRVCKFWYITLTFSNYQKYIEGRPFLFFDLKKTSISSWLYFQKKKKCCIRRFTSFYKDQILIYKNCCLIQYNLTKKENLYELCFENFNADLCCIFLNLNLKKKTNKISLLNEKNKINFHATNNNSHLSQYSYYLMTEEGVLAKFILNESNTLECKYSYSFPIRNLDSSSISKKKVQQGKVIGFYKNHSSIYLFQENSISKWKFIKLGLDPIQKHAIQIWIVFFPFFQNIQQVDSCCLTDFSSFSSSLIHCEKGQKEQSILALILHMHNHQEFNLYTQVLCLKSKDGKILQNWKPGLKENKEYLVCCMERNYFYFLQANGCLQVFNWFGNQTYIYHSIIKNLEFLPTNMHVYNNYLYLVEHSTLGTIINFKEISMKY